MTVVHTRCEALEQGRVAIAAVARDQKVGIHLDRLPRGRPREHGVHTPTRSCRRASQRETFLGRRLPGDGMRFRRPQFRRRRLRDGEKRALLGGRDHSQRRRGHPRGQQPSRGTDRFHRVTVYDHRLQTLGILLRQVRHQVHDAFHGSLILERETEPVPGLVPPPGN